MRRQCRSDGLGNWPEQAVAIAVPTIPDHGRAQVNRIGVPRRNRLRSQRLLCITATGKHHMVRHGTVMRCHHQKRPESPRNHRSWRRSSTTGKFPYPKIESGGQSFISGQVRSRIDRQGVVAANNVLDHLRIAGLAVANLHIAHDGVIEITIRGGFDVFSGQPPTDDHANFSLIVHPGVDAHRLTVVIRSRDINHRGITPFERTSVRRKYDIYRPI